MGRHDGLWQLTMADPHTGLANKHLTLDRLDQALARRERHHGQVMVLYIDLINLDEYGYALGMEALVGLSGRITASLRSEDTAGRVSGTAFTVVVSIDDEETMASIAATPGGFVPAAICHRWPVRAPLRAVRRCRCQNQRERGRSPGKGTCSVRGITVGICVVR